MAAKEGAMRMAMYPALLVISAFTGRSMAELAPWTAEQTVLTGSEYASVYGVGG